MMHGVKNTRLGTIEPICCENLDNKNYSLFPDPMLFENIPLIWNFLDMVVQDWERGATSFESVVKNITNESEKEYHTLKAFAELQPLYLKCLFSYAFFFVSLDGAYDRFYEQLNKLNRKSFLQVSHARKPKSTPYIKKVKMVRDLSIAHIGSKKAKSVNVAAATSWQPMTLGKKIGESWDINKMTFGEFKLSRRNSTNGLVEEADDFEIVGILELDNQCKSYLHAYDQICVDYLKEIHKKLPFTNENRRYYKYIVGS